MKLHKLESRVGGFIEMERRQMIVMVEGRRKRAQCIPLQFQFGSGIDLLSQSQSGGADCEPVQSSCLPLCPEPASALLEVALTLPCLSQALQGQLTSPLSSALQQLPHHKICSSTFLPIVCCCRDQEHLL